MIKDLQYNQESVYPKQYQLYPSGIIKARLVHILSPGGCSECYERDRRNYVDGNKVWRKIEFDANNLIKDVTK